MIAIVDYGMGNLGSMANMCRKIGVPAVVSSDAGQIAAADRLVLPGVGAFDSGMKSLRGRDLVLLLQRLVIDEKRPILGVCLGLQLFTRGSQEGQEEGLGWLPARTVRFPPATPPLRIPHMGWNSVDVTRPHALFRGLEKDARFYFVHSFHVASEVRDDVAGETMYGCRFPSVLIRGNIMGVQFHPEKSHRYGMQLLRNFADMGPC